jgi:hypothetical protein
MLRRLFIALRALFRRRPAPRRYQPLWVVDDESPRKDPGGAWIPVDREAARRRGLLRPPTRLQRIRQLRARF